MKRFKNAAQMLCIMFLAVFFLTGCVAPQEPPNEEPPEQTDEKTEYVLQFEEQEYILVTGESKDLSITFTADGAAADTSLLKFTSAPCRTAR